VSPSTSVRPARPPHLAALGLALVAAACHGTTGHAAAPACASPTAPVAVYGGAAAVVVGDGWWYVGGDDDFGPYDAIVSGDGTTEEDPPASGDTTDPGSGDPNADPGTDDGAGDDGSGGDGAGDDSTTLALHPRSYAGGCFTCAIVCTTDADPLTTTGASAVSTAAACRDAQRRLAAYAPGRLVACSRAPSDYTPSTPSVVTR
jgi:hypothetical protein